MRETPQGTANVCLSFFSQRVMMHLRFSFSTKPSLRRSSVSDAFAVAECCRRRATVSGSRRRDDVRGREYETGNEFHLSNRHENSFRAV